jgi:rhodanese-related sulfurtransferase
MSSTAPTNDVPEVTRPELIRALRDGGITLVDVLSPESFARNHIPGAINIPVAELATAANALLVDRRQAIVTYCGGPT